MTQPTVGQAMKGLATTVQGLSGGGVTMETVEGLDQQGRVRIRGVYTGVPPGTRALSTGDQVAVAWEHGKPRIVLSQEARRIQPVPPRGVVVVGGVVEVLAIVAEGAARSVWFANDSFAAKLDLALDGKVANRVGWGVGANGFWVLTTDDWFYIFRVKRLAKDQPLKEKVPQERAAKLRPWQSGIKVVTIQTQGQGSGILVNGHLESVNNEIAEHTGEVNTVTNVFTRIGDSEYSWTQAGTYQVNLTETFWNNTVRVQDIQLNEALDLLLTIRMNTLGYQALQNITGTPNLPQVKSGGYSWNYSGSYTDPGGGEPPVPDEGTGTEDGDPANCAGIVAEPGTQPPAASYYPLDGHLGILNATRGEWIFKSWEDSILTVDDQQDKVFGLMLYSREWGHDNVAGLEPPEGGFIPLPELWAWWDRGTCGPVNIATYLPYQAFSTTQFNSQKATNAPGVPGAPTDVPANRTFLIGVADLFDQPTLAGLGLTDDHLYGEEAASGDYYRWGPILVSHQETGPVGGPYTVTSNVVEIKGFHQAFTGVREFRKRNADLAGVYVPGRGKSKGVLWVRVLLQGLEENLKLMWGLAHLNLDTKKWTVVHPTAEVDGLGQSQLWVIGATLTHVLYGYQHNPLAGVSTSTPYLADYFLAGVSPVAKLNVGTATTYSQGEEVIRYGLQLMRTEYAFMPKDIKSAKTKNRMALLWEFPSGKLVLKDLLKAPAVDSAMTEPMTVLEDIEAAAKKKNPAAVVVQDSYPNRFSFFDQSYIMGYPQLGPAYHVLNNTAILTPVGRYKNL